MRALVTGASSGIGAAIARDLAARGAKVVLTARRERELAEVAKSCPGAEIVVADLSQAGGVDAVWAAATAAGPVQVLVNNAGFGYLRTFAESQWTRDAELLQLNIASLVALTRHFLDQHSAPPSGGAARSGKAGPIDTKPTRGFILNIASIGAYQAVPNMSLYSASKAFVRDFTEGLHDELAGGAVSATCVCPGGTHTEFHAVAGAGNYGWLARSSMKSADEVARYAVRAMLARRRIAIPGLMNKLSCWGVRLIPRWLASWIAKRIMGRPKKETSVLGPRSSAGDS
jgi:short-subunit dehydrogenase